MLNGNCTESLSIQAHVMISGSSAKLIRNSIAPLPFPTAIELRSADFSPPRSGPAKTAGSGLKSALLSCRDSLNSITLTVLYRSKDGQMSRVFTNRSQLVGLRRSFVVQILPSECVERGRDIA